MPRSDLSQLSLFNLHFSPRNEVKHGFSGWVFWTPLCELYVYLFCLFFGGIADLFLLDYKSPSYIIEVCDFFLSLLSSNFFFFHVEMFDFYEVKCILFFLLWFSGVFLLLCLEKVISNSNCAKIPLFSSENVFFISGSSSFDATRIGVCFKVWGRDPR